MNWNLMLFQWHREMKGFYVRCTFPRYGRAEMKVRADFDAPAG